jgi:hypothetical protein
MSPANVAAMPVYLTRFKKPASAGFFVFAAQDLSGPGLAGGMLLLAKVLFTSGYCRCELSYFSYTEFT